MYGLLVLSQTLNWFTRVGMPQLVPFIVTDMALSEASRALLMGAFFPPYVAMQIPSALLERYTGAKALIVGNLLGLGGCLLAMPAAGRHSVQLLAWLQAVMGFFAAFLFPMQKVLLREWAPLSLGTERVWALRAGGFGMQAGIVGTTFLTPLLATRYGWRQVPRLYGMATVVGGVLWQLIAVNKPSQWKGISSSELALLDPSQEKSTDEDKDARAVADEVQVERSGNAAPAARSALPPRLLVHPSVLSTFWINVADNASMYTLQQWALVWFTEHHATSAAQAGGFLAAANIVNVAGQFVSAGVESALLRHGYSLLSIRRLGGGLGSLCQAAGVFLFGLAPSPLLASLVFSAHNLAESFTSNAYEANYIEFGGVHCAALYSVGNALANIPVSNQL
jgi:MFS family permease